MKIRARLRNGTCMALLYFRNKELFNEWGAHVNRCVNFSGGDPLLLRFLIGDWDSIYVLGTHIHVTQEMVSL